MLMKIDDVLNYKIGIIGLGVLGSAIAECFINKKIIWHAARTYTSVQAKIACENTESVQHVKTER